MFLNSTGGYAWSRIELDACVDFVHCAFRLNRCATWLQSGWKYGAQIQIEPWQEPRQQHVTRAIKARAFVSV